jgi:hypothetical protein
MGWQAPSPQVSRRPRPRPYAYGKLATAWSELINLGTNQDFRDDPIWPPNPGLADLPEVIKRALGDFASKYEPIIARPFTNAEAAQTEGLTTTEKALAIRKAPLSVANPKAASDFFTKLREHPKGSQERWKAKLLREERERRAQQP